MEHIKTMPNISELFLINNRCDLSSLNMIITSITKSISLKKLSLQKMGLSDVQLQTIFDYIKKTNITELDISWNKIPINLVCKLF